MRGKFITFEGPEGSGKSTVIKKIEEKLRENSIDYLITKEPGSPKDPVCVELREFILNPSRDIDKETEIFLYIADRCQHVNKVIRPALESGKVVICDRYIDSTYAYQGWGRRHGTVDALNYINYLNEKSTGSLIPDLTLILQVTPEEGFKRLTTTEFGKKDRIEQEKIDFFERVNKGFDHLLQNSKDRNIIAISTDEITAEDVAKISWNCILDKLNDTNRTM